MVEVGRTENIDSEATSARRSIENLDNISDTTIVGITFLLAALGTWVNFGFTRVHGTIYYLFLVIVIVESAILVTSLAYIIRALFPRSFKVDTAGDPLLRSMWVPPPFGSAEPVDDNRKSLFRSGSEEDAKRWLESETDIPVPEELSVEHKKLYVFKKVAGEKARHVSIGLSWLRLGVVGLFVVVLVGVLGPCF